MIPQHVKPRPMQGYPHVSMGSGVIPVIGWYIRPTRMCPIASSMCVQQDKEAPEENEKGRSGPVDAQDANMQYTRVRASNAHLFDCL